MATAFATSSSNATLPTAPRAAEERLHLPREVSTFVLTVGATANQNGTALYEGVTVLFLAQLYGVDLTLSQQLMLLVFAILAGVGTAGVPSGSIPFIVLILQSIHVPPEGIAVILGVDRLLDMCRAVPNVTGDLVLVTGVARSEGGPTSFARSPRRRRARRLPGLDPRRSLPHRLDELSLGPPPARAHRRSGSAARNCSLLVAANSRTASFTQPVSVMSG
jgi:Na+/H+-dicarboxylate symporter